MCVVSMIMDHYGDKWSQLPRPVVPAPVYTPGHVLPPAVQPITPEEIAEFRRLLELAREYDRKNNEPDCELEEKRERVRNLAKELGVEVEFV